MMMLVTSLFLTGNMISLIIMIQEGMRWQMRAGCDVKEGTDGTSVCPCPKEDGEEEKSIGIQGRVLVAKSFAPTISLIARVSSKFPVSATW